MTKDESSIGSDQRVFGDFRLVYAGDKDADSNSSVNEDAYRSPSGPDDCFFFVIAAVTLGGLVLGFKGIYGDSDLMLFGGWLVTAIGIAALVAMIIGGHLPSFSHVGVTSQGSPAATTAPPRKIVSASSLISGRILIASSNERPRIGVNPPDNSGAVQ